MDRTSISRRIGSIKGDIEKLSNTLCAIEKTDIENYPENYAMLTTDAALRSELIACRMRHLLYGSTTTRKETYLASAGVVQGIRIQAQENMLEITLPCLLPKRKQRQSTEFLIDPLYFTLSQYSDNNGLPKFRQCVVCFSHIYSEKFHNRRVRDYDNLELKQLLDVLSTFIMVDDTGLLVDAYMRCFSASKKYCKDNPYCKFQYPKPDDVRTKRLQKAGITDTDELAAAVECFDTLLQSAVIPPDPNAIRLRDMLYRAKMYQKGDIQFTPPELAKELVALAGVRKDSRVLEPEAGIGNIADAAKEVTDHVDCIERMTDFCEILKLKKHNVIGNDLLTAETAPIYDAVVMNPPFSEECEHIKRAFDFLRPGGSLVAVCSSSIQWKSTRKYEQFRDWLSEHTHSIDECGAKFEMTGVHTVVLVVDKAA